MMKSKDGKSSLEIAIFTYRKGRYLEDWLDVNHLDLFKSGGDWFEKCGQGIAGEFIRCWRQKYW